MLYHQVNDRLSVSLENGLSYIPYVSTVTRDSNSQLSELSIINEGMITHKSKPKHITHLLPEKCQ